MLKVDDVINSYKQLHSAHVSSTVISTIYHIRPHTSIKPPLLNTFSTTPTIYTQLSLLDTHQHQPKKLFKSENPLYLYSSVT